MRARQLIFNSLVVANVLLLLGAVGLWGYSSLVAQLDWKFAGPFNMEWQTYVGKAWSQFDIVFYKTQDDPELGIVGHDVSYTLDGGISQPSTAFLFWPKQIEFDVWPLDAQYSVNLPGAYLYWQEDGSWYGHPYWLLLDGGVHLFGWVLMYSILPAIWLFKWNRRRKLGPNACPSCGYDLTGNESGKCSECGVATKPEAAQT